MDTKTLEELLEGAVETPSIEFKCSCEWDVKLFAKDILAISNLRDGGYIIVGVENSTFIRKGIQSEHKQTFKIDDMKDQMAAYADPHINISLKFPKDQNGLEYAVIIISTYFEIPVICKKDGPDTKAGVIYYRNSNRRVESAAVSNSYDMRNIIDVAVFRSMRRRVSLENSFPKMDEKSFDKELEGL